MPSSAESFKRKAIADILDTGIAALMKKADELGAQCGAGGVGILVDKRLYILCEPFRDWMSAFDPTKTWPEDEDFDPDNPRTGINYVGYALMKMAQSVRTGKPSQTIGILGYGEADDIGCAVGKCFIESLSEDYVTIFAVFSGMTSKYDLISADTSVYDMQSTTYLPVE